MERLLDLIFWIVGLFNVRSSDPVLAAFKHARRATILCTVAQFIFLALAFTFDVESAVPASQVSHLVDQGRNMVANGFALIAVAFMLGMVWFSCKCLHIYFKPERYLD